MSTKQGEQNGRIKHVFRIALPIIGGMASQNVVTLFDTAMLSHLGDSALAAVGFGSFIFFVLSAFFMGGSAGVQALAARRIGEGNEQKAAEPLHAGLMWIGILAVPWSIGLSIMAPTIFNYLAEDHVVAAIGGPYLRVRLLAVAALGANFAFRGFFSAIDKPGLYLRTLISMHLLNIGLNVIFIYGQFGFPQLGVLGAGIANAISLWFGTLSYFVLGLKHAKRHGFFQTRPTYETLKRVAKISLPAGLQQFLFAAGMTVFFGILTKMGTREAAASKVLIDLLLVGVLPGIGFGIASATLVGQSLGRKDPSDASRWGWDVVKVATLIVGCLALPALVIPEFLLSIFLKDATTRELAVPILRLIALGLASDTVGTVLTNALIGAGDTRRVMIVSVSLQWLLFLPCVWLLGVKLQLGLFNVFVAQFVYRQLLALVFGVMFARGEWKKIEM